MKRLGLRAETIRVRSRGRRSDNLKGKIMIRHTTSTASNSAGARRPATLLVAGLLLSFAGAAAAVSSDRAKLTQIEDLSASASRSGANAAVGSEANWPSSNLKNSASPTAQDWGRAEPISRPNIVPVHRSHAQTPQPRNEGIPMTMQQDLARRSPDIFWPDGLAPDQADMFAYNELSIAAPCDRVWRHLIDAKRWSDYYPNGKNVVIQSGADVNGMLQQGTMFQWDTFGARWDTRVHEFEAPFRVGWFGGPVGGGPTAYHAWLLQPRDGGCFVITEEVGIGDGAKTVRETDEGMMNRGHDLWLAGLRFVSEGADK
jgi:hypothetical protein